MSPMWKKTSMKLKQIEKIPVSKTFHFAEGNVVKEKINELIDAYNASLKEQGGKFVQVGKTQKKPKFVTTWASTEVREEEQDIPCTYCGGSATRHIHRKNCQRFIKSNPTLLAWEKEFDSKFIELNGEFVDGQYGAFGEVQIREHLKSFIRQEIEKARKKLVQDIKSKILLTKVEDPYGNWHNTKPTLEEYISRVCGVLESLSSESKKEEV